MTSGAKLCLNMIVKNEASNINRCLNGVADHISCWVIGDTGSTDGTKEIIQDFFDRRNIPGELHCFPFETFDQARNEALERAKNSSLKFDYILFADADMELVVSNSEFRTQLTAEVYQILQKSGVAYWNSRILRRDAQASYVGVTHEYLDLKRGSTQQLSGLFFVDHASGANRAGKFARDAALLTQALETEQNSGLRARYTFYLANSFRDHGDHTRALEHYLERAQLGGWNEEIYVSLMNAGQLMALLKYATDDVVATFEKATKFSPGRVEALHGVARFLREKGQYERGYQCALRGESLPVPDDGLFISEWVYEYGLLDELAITAYWTDRYSECCVLCNRLLARPSLPLEFRERIERNRQFALDKLSTRIKTSKDGYKRVMELLSIARDSEKSGRPIEQTIAAYMDAAEAGPVYTEPLHDASRFCRYKSLHEKGYHLAARGLEILDSSYEVIPGESWISEFGILDELSVHAYWTGRYEVSVKICDRLLRENKMPIDMRDRVIKNRQFSLERIVDSTAKSDEIRVAVWHPDWSEFLLLNPVYGTVRSEILNRKGSYTLDDSVLVVSWNGSDFETFDKRGRLFVLRRECKRNEQSVLRKNSIALKKVCLVRTYHNSNEACCRIQSDPLIRGLKNIDVDSNIVSDVSDINEEFLQSPPSHILFHFFDSKAVSIVTAIKGDTQAKILCFASDIYNIEIYVRLADLVDAFLVPTLLHKQIIEAATSKSCFYLPESVDQISLPTDGKEISVSQEGRICWFGYPESFNKSMKYVFQYLLQMNIINPDEFAIITKRQEIILAGVNHVAFDFDDFYQVTSQFSFSIVSHFSFDLHMNSYIKSPNKLITSIVRGFVPFFSQTPSYTDLAKNYGLEGLGFSSGLQLGKLIKNRDYRQSYEKYHLDEVRKSIISDFSEKAIAIKFVSYFP